MVVLVAALAFAGLLYVRTTGLRGQPEPGALETRLARAVRAIAVPSDVKTRTNPLGASEEVFRPGMEHFARYCAMCHANDGSGTDTPFGKGLFPKPPDLRGEATRGLTDGEILYIIENGVRFTGMPAFGTGSPDPAGEKLAWQLVAFIRHLPTITSDEIGEMQALNPL
jgi:mono/diheme cytochrome c family protein